MALIFWTLIGSLVGTLAGVTGIGGGVLISPLMLLNGFSKSEAVGTSFLAMVFLVITSVVFHGTQSNINWKVGLTIGISAAIGAIVAGKYLLPILPVQWMRYLLALILISLAIILLVKD